MTFLENAWTGLKNSTNKKCGIPVDFALHNTEFCLWVRDAHCWFWQASEQLPLPTFALSVGTVTSLRPMEALSPLRHQWNYMHRPPLQDFSFYKKWKTVKKSASVKFCSAGHQLIKHACKYSGNGLELTETGVAVMISHLAPQQHLRTERFTAVDHIKKQI